MQTCIALLRGVNVSGQKLIKMKALQAMFENLGFSNVLTYIQSGNVVFDVKPTDTGGLEQMISGAILKTFGFTVSVIVLDKAYLKNISEHNAFISERGLDISKLHLTFLSGDPGRIFSESMKQNEYLPDEFYISGKAIYLFCPNGAGNTKLSNASFEKKLKVRATSRNWKTVLELVKLSERKNKEKE